MSDVRNGVIPTFTLTEASAGSILAALRDVGCVVLVDAVPARAVMNCYSAARHAFELSSIAIRCPHDAELEVGYSPPGAERVRGGEPEMNRCFLDLAPDGGFIQDAVIDPPLRLFADKLSTLCDRLVELVLPQALGVAEPQARRRRLRLTNYRAEKVGPEHVLMGEHCDPNLLTLYAGGAQPGLQVKIKNTWVPVDIDADCVLVGVGTVLRKYDNRARALLHQVVASAAWRTSIALFVGPDPEVRFPDGGLASEFYARMRAFIRA